MRKSLLSNLLRFSFLCHPGSNLVVTPSRTRQHTEKGTRVVNSIAGIATAVA